MLINSDVLGICERIQKGDPTCAWAGDPRMFVQFNPVTEKYEVWRRCEDGKDRIISSWEARQFDSRVLKALSEGDLWNRDVISEIEKREDRLMTRAERELDQIEGELKSDVKWMKKKLYLPGEDAPTPSGTGPGSRKRDE